MDRVEEPYQAHSRPVPKLRALAADSVRLLVEMRFTATTIDAKLHTFLNSLLSMFVAAPCNQQEEMVDILATAAKVRAGHSSDESWSELAAFLETALASRDKSQEGIALAILNCAPGAFGDGISSILPSLMTVLQRSLQGEDRQVQSTAFNVLAAVMDSYYEVEDAIVRSLSTLLPIALKVWKADFDDPHIAVLNNLVRCQDDTGDCHRDVAKELEPYLADIVTSACEIMCNSGSARGDRVTAAELLTSLSLFTTELINARSDRVVPEMVNACLILLADLSDEWEDDFQAKYWNPPSLGSSMKAAESSSPHDLKISKSSAQ